MRPVKKSLKYLLFTFLISLVLIQCAKRGNPTGGALDEDPPEILRAYPDNYTTNFDSKEIVIQFDEYVTFKDLNKQLVISPPMDYPPVILPQGGVSREVVIRIVDTLKDNTTYVMNFGQSLVDNNESNPYPYLKYVFSTGDYIDSLQLKGTINNVLEYDTSNFVNVLLYEIDSTYTDSAIYKENPDYVLNTLDSLQTFTLENLRAGTYQMIALKEENSDYRFDPSRDMIAFYPEPIMVPSDETYELNLYKQVADRRIARATHEAKNRIHLGYYGELDSLNIHPLDSTLILESRITRLEQKDTLQYWFKPTKDLDSILMKASLREFEEEFQVKFKKDLEPDSLIISKTGKFSLAGDLEFTAATPIENVDKSRMLLLDNDSLEKDISSTLDKFTNVASLDFEREENQRYQLAIYPGAITDFFGAKNPDTLNWKYSTRSTRDYGNVFVNLTGGKDFPVIVQVVSKNLKVLAEKTVTKNGVVEFDLIDPSDYYIRLIYDANKNGRYDPGNILNNQQPERIEYLRKTINLKPNWDVNETINLD